MIFKVILVLLVVLLNILLDLRVVCIVTSICDCYADCDIVDGLFVDKCSALDRNKTEPEAIAFRALYTRRCTRSSTVDKSAHDAGIMCS